MLLACTVHMGLHVTCAWCAAYSVVLLHHEHAYACSSCLILQQHCHFLIHFLMYFTDQACTDVKYAYLALQCHNLAMLQQMVQCVRLRL